MPPLILVPCSSSKSLPASEGLRGHDLQVLTSALQISTWRERVVTARPRRPVPSLYKGGAWAIAREAAAEAIGRGGGARVVSAGLGLPSFDDLVPSYDITFSAGSPNLIPGGASPEARATWWQGIAGADALARAFASGPYTALMVALPEAYLEAVAPSVANLISVIGADCVSILSSQLSPFTRAKVIESWVPVTANQTTVLRGNAGQTSLVALLYTLQNMPPNQPFTRTSVLRLLERLHSRNTPLYPKREHLGYEHARAWIAAANASPNPPKSASDALRRYRGAGYALEQKAFHRLFADVVEVR